MTAVQLLEKLGADSQFDKAQLSSDQLNDLIHLSGCDNDDDEFHPPLLHDTPDDEDDEDSSRN